jgi:S-(hydroxymethyl)glutathione dehydrogenase/alcohol dehydrogenase
VADPLDDCRTVRQRRPEDLDPPFQLVTVHEWRGSAFGGARGRTDVPKIVDWYTEGKLNIDGLITHRLPLERINEGFDLMKSGESIRSVLLY